MRIAADSDAAHAHAAIVVEFFATVLSGPRDVAALETLLAPDFVDHDATGDDAGIPGVAAKLAGLWAALPDGAYVLEHVVAAGDDVVERK